ncbi:MAG: adenosylcobinamide-phosphate synthase CbiB [Synergistaceae bacterium]|nr:adenosylcobinamide-phosphate synthase CbiB [Synergistaceae bacterium]
MISGAVSSIVAAVFLDAVLGDPPAVPHPVRLIGALISFIEARIYRESGRFRGAILTISVVALVAAAVWGSLSALSFSPLLSGVFEVYLLYAALAWRSLKDESLPVAACLWRGDVNGGRQALSRIVGRDTNELDEADMVRAAVETVGENSIDGIFSVLFYMTLGLLAGQPALFAWIFKAVSTMDSMIGYRSDRYRDFGWFAARCDDALNFIPARLGTVLLLIGGAVCGLVVDMKVIAGVLGDRLKHPSPNSAHGESAMAWLLGISLGGESRYGGVTVRKPVIGRGARTPVPEDIIASHRIVDGGAAAYMLVLVAVNALLSLR